MAIPANYGTASYAVRSAITATAELLVKVPVYRMRLDCINNRKQSGSCTYHLPAVSVMPIKSVTAGER